MMDGTDSRETFGASVERLPWSWSYLRRPVVLVLWLASAALSALLAERKSPRRRTPPVAAHAPSRRPGIMLVPPDARDDAGRADHDDEARAA